MMHEMKPEDLLEGPRGRRLCAAVAYGGHHNGGTPVWRALFNAAVTSPSRDSNPRVVLSSNSDDEPTARARSHQLPSPEEAIAQLVEALQQFDLRTVSELTELNLLWCLADSVGSAMYWQPPADEDSALARPEVRRALIPIAEQVLRANAAHWLGSALDTVHQCYVQWLDQAQTDPPRLEGVAEKLQALHEKEARRELRARSLPSDPAANYSGAWWSIPAGSKVVETSRSFPWLGATGLMLNEDSLGWKHARVWPLVPNPDARVYEITGPEAWVKLVERYPFDVTLSRRHDWWRATGRAGRWFIPDWQAVAADYDGVHLAVLGYLTTAGRALDLGIDDRATVLAGWDPDDTYWLNDVLSHTPSVSPVEWRLHDSSTNEAYWAPEVDG